MNQAGKIYIQHVELLLDCTLRQKRNAMADVKHIVRLYLEDDPQASYEDISAELGNPERMAEELMQDIPMEERIRGRWMQKQLYRAIIGILLAISIAIVGETVYVIRNPWYLRHFTSIPADERAWYYPNSQKYGLTYELDEDGYITSAIDQYGNLVEVNEKGMPITEYGK